MEDKIQGFMDALDSRKVLRTVTEAAFLPVSVLYMEVLAKLWVFGKAFDDKFIYLLTLSLSLSFLAGALSMIIPGRGRRIFYKALLCLLAVWFSFHITYYSNFHTFFSWQTLGQAKDVTEFWKEALVAASGVWYLILAFFVPMIVSIAMGRMIIPDEAEKSLPAAGALATLFLAFYIPTVIQINSTGSNTDEYTPYYYYTYLQSDLDLSYRYFGIINTTRLDIKQLIFGAPTEQFDITDFDDIKQPIEVSHVSDSDQPAVEYGYNVMEIDFDKAAASTKSQDLINMDQYFKVQQPTSKNEYTGMFEGKNLIFITLEGFSDKIIDPEFTPTLYKMSTEGFVFSNFYNTVWGGSTASGEYSNLTGNFYTTANCLQLSAKTYQPFALGNQFRNLGYKTIAYHNNTYTYYGRDKSHPNFGYEWKAIGHGMKLKSECWPRSDLEMAQATVGEYSNLDQPFHVYYMSFSGHSGYFFDGNAMSKRHEKDLLPKHKKMHRVVQAYIACQYEVELMLQELVNKLDEAGQLENTVFAMTADHYPYPLGDSQLAALYNLPAKNIRNNFELYRNGFILWSPSMKEPVVVDKPCSTIDILPTISNLFGLEYDSRIMMGSDIMAEGDHFALLKVNGWSWISTQGEYNSTEKVFTPSKNCTMTTEEQNEYVKRMNKIVRAKTTYSKLMLDRDYYRHIFNK